MHRLLVATEELEKDAPALAKEARDHLKVLRPKDGEEIELFDGKGRWRVYRAEGGGRGARVVGCGRMRDGNEPAPPPLTLFACVTKGSRWDWTIEKATELGATRIVPVVSARTIVRIAPDEREAKRARWTRVAEDAARQSDAKWIPEVLAPVTFAESLALVRETTCFVGALTTPPPQTIGEAVGSRGWAAREGTSRTEGTFEGNRPVCVVSCESTRSARASRAVAIYVGPEGDFTPEELAALLKIATPVSFGSTILRAETAAIYGLGVLKAYADSRAVSLRPHGAGEAASSGPTVPVPPPKSRGDVRYPLVEIFESLQGEGRNTGRPCVFVRFAGCNLACPWCDTDVSKRFELALEDIVREVCSHETKSVILTGGEPTTVAEMDGLVVALKEAGRWIAVETNGTRDRTECPWLDKVDYVACSPKVEFPDSLRLRAADEVRVVASGSGRGARAASEEQIADFCRAVRAKIAATDYYVSPCERGGAIDYATAKSVLGRLDGWSLSVQLHKVLGFR